MSESSHTFTIDTPAGTECARCGVTVDPDRVEALTVACPAGGCPAPVNHGEGCVFIPADPAGRVECSYCERPGDPHGRWAPLEDDDDDLDWLDSDPDDDPDGDTLDLAG